MKNKRITLNAHGQETICLVRNRVGRRASAGAGRPRLVLFTPTSLNATAPWPLSCSTSSAPPGFDFHIEISTYSGSLCNVQPICPYDRGSFSLDNQLLTSVTLLIVFETSFVYSTFGSWIQLLRILAHVTFNGSYFRINLFAELVYK